MVSEALSSILQGLQSVMFYYLSCAPCHACKQRRQRKKKVKRLLIERAKQPATKEYLQPVETCTNPFWHKEMALGPAAPKKSKRKWSLRHHAVFQTSRCKAVAETTGSSDGDKQPRCDDSGVFPQQREDEILWGIHIQEPDPVQLKIALLRDSSLASTVDIPTETEMVVAFAGDSCCLSHPLDLSNEHSRLSQLLLRAGEEAGRLVEAVTATAKSPRSRSRSREDHESSNNSNSLSKKAQQQQQQQQQQGRVSYQNYRANMRPPPVNDYHPAVVSSRPTHADGKRWMLQPPPPAAVMNGRRASYSLGRSTCGGSDDSVLRAMSLKGRPPVSRLPTSVKVTATADSAAVKRVGGSSCLRPNSRKSSRDSGAMKRPRKSSRENGTLSLQVRNGSSMNHSGFEVHISTIAEKAAEESRPTAEAAAH